MKTCYMVFENVLFKKQKYVDFLTENSVLKVHEVNSYKVKVRHNYNFAQLLSVGN